MFEEAREKIPMTVDDPGEYFMPAGPDKPVKWLIPLKVTVLPTNFRRMEVLGRGWGLLAKTPADQEKR